MNKNRGSVATKTIAEKLKQVEDDLGIVHGSIENSSTPPRLFINGRLDRKQYAYTAKNFAILSKLDVEIKSVCKGVDLTILNYLIYLGLNEIKKSDQFKSLEYSDFEAEIQREF